MRVTLVIASFILPHLSLTDSVYLGSKFLCMWDLSCQYSRDWGLHRCYAVTIACCIMIWSCRGLYPQCTNAHIKHTSYICMYCTYRINFGFAFENCLWNPSIGYCYSYHFPVWPLRYNNTHQSLQADLNITYFLIQTFWQQIAECTLWMLLFQDFPAGWNGKKNRRASC